jgi:hypothetical protein
MDCRDCKHPAVLAEGEVLFAVNKVLFAFDSPSRADTPGIPEPECRNRFASVAGEYGSAILICLVCPDS